MNKVLIIVGLVVIITGAVIMSGYSISWTRRDVVTPPVNYVPKEGEDPQWSVAGELKEGDWLIVTFRHSAYWTDYTLQWEEAAPEEGIPIPHFYVSITIADPYGNETRFVEAVGLQQNTQYPRLVNFPPEITKNGSLHTILAADEGGVQGVGGIVQYDGLYNVSMTAEYRYPLYPPSYIGMFLYKVTENRDAALLPVGAIVVGLGVTLSYFGLRKRKPEVKVKRA